MLDEILNGNIERRVFLTLHQQITKRIFDDGKDSNNQKIGSYSKGYIERRKKKGLGGSKKVNLQFTGQMKNDFLLIEQNGKFGSGFTNSRNADKSEWVESTYNKDIFSPTTQEEKLAQELFEDEINRIIGQGN